MQTFAYTARDQSGTPFSGTLSAGSADQVIQQLRGEGKYPIAVNPVTNEAPQPQIASPEANIKIPAADVVQIATQLSIMLETGVTLSEALECIAAQCERPNVKRLVEDLCRQVQSGNDLSSALSRHPRSFPQLFIALIKASEKSGMLSKLLTRATRYMRDEQDTLRRVKGALTYPGIMLAFAVTTTIFLLAFVLPRFTTIYSSKQAALPVPTRVLMAMSTFIVDHWPMLIMGAGITALMGWFYFRSPGGRRLWHYVQLHTPLMGPMFRKLHLSRGLRMLGTMSGAGVNLVECVSTARSLSGNTYFEALWQDVSEQIEAGRQLSEPLFQSNLVPRGVAQMLHSGEKGGKLSHVMEQVAGFAEEELKEKIAEMTRYIEPVMIVVMGLIIGGVALALLLPIFTISRVMSN